MPPSSVNIPGLPVGLMLTADAVFPAVQNGVDKQFTIGQLTAFAQSSAAVALIFQPPLAQSGSNVTLAGFNPATDNGVIYRASSVAIGVTAVGSIGQLLLGNGVGNPPSWLSVATTTGQLLAGTLGAAPQWISAGVTGQVLIGVTGGQPIWSSTIPGDAGVDTFSAGVTGLTPTSPTTGNVVLGGVLLPGSGGSGITATTGSGPNNVLSTQPSLLSAQLTTPLLTSPVITGQLTYGGVLLAPSVSGLGSMALTSAPSFNAPTITSALTYGGVTLSAAVTGTGAMVLQSTPTLISAVLFNASGYSAAAVVGLVNQSILGPTTRNLVSGTVATYTTPAGAKWLEVRFVGGGGGGGGVGVSTQPAGGTGNVTIFNGISAAGGVGGPGAVAGGVTGGAGGTGGGGTATLRFPGNAGGFGLDSTGAAALGSGFGAGSHFGGGTPGTGLAGTTGASAAANTGAGGAGGSGTIGSTQNAAGGGSGEYVELVINNPAATYLFTVGNGGAGGIGTGTSAVTGGAGGSGVITVREHYNYG